VQLLVSSILNLDSNRATLDTFYLKEGGVKPSGVVLVQDEHTSISDKKPHYTMDVYGELTRGVHGPIGCIHVYGDTKEVVPYSRPRSAIRHIVEAATEAFNKAMATGSDTIDAPDAYDP